MSTIELTWDGGSASVSPLAAMVTSASFDVGGLPFAPFAPNPWRDEEGIDALHGHVRGLGGDFVGVPFGSAGGPAEPTAGWEHAKDMAEPQPPHGASAEVEWVVTDVGDSSVELVLDYDIDGCRVNLRRTITGVRSSLRFALSVRTDAPLRTTVGLHPILRLPEHPGGLRLTAPFVQGFTYPGTVHPGAGVARPGQRFDSLGAVPGSRGAVDLRMLPLGHPVEDVVQLTGTTGIVTAEYLEEKVAVDVTWDSTILPSAQLWISDRALQEHPWNGRYRGLGIEPIASAFDLPPAVSVGANPISASGVPTSLLLEPGSPTRIIHAVTARPLSLKPRA